MREILFRGKRKDNGKWVEGYLLETFRPVHKVFIVKTIDISVSKSGMTIYDSQIYEVIPETVGQYTGLTDKNGKKIFEGDIVRRVTDGAIAKIINISGAVFEIDFIDDECAISDFAHYDGTDFEVIGNIHDNPELLESEPSEAESEDAE